MKRLNNLNCSIGIVTYLGRFEAYFKPLIRKLHFLFPNYDINVFINGHHDIVRQVQYLREVTELLAKYRNVRYMTNINHQALARGWNWLILMAACDKVLMLNDDVTINMEFRHNLEDLSAVPEFFLINQSWSHFVVSKRIVRDVGWFDERFVGIGCEDHDYTFRLAMRGITTETIAIHGIVNQSAPQEDHGWANISDIDNEVGRHSQVNRDFLKKKWFWSDYGAVPERGSFKVWYPAYNLEWVVAPNEAVEDMPEYYPMNCLDNLLHHKPAIKYSLLSVISKGCSYFNSIYWKARQFLGIGVFLRRVFGSR